MHIEKKKRMRLTPRDLQLLAWMNSVGYVSIDHISTWMGVAKSTAYLRMKKMLDQEYVTHDRIFCGLPGVYRVSQLGVQACGSDLPSVRKVAIGSYHHDLAVTTLSLELSKIYQSDYVPERQIRHQEGVTGFGKTGHTPDSVLMLGEKKIAIELELNKKGKKRRDAIVGHYMKSFSYDEVWYFCGHKEIKKHMDDYQSQAPFLKTFTYPIIEPKQEASDEQATTQFTC